LFPDPRRIPVLRSALAGRGPWPCLLAVSLATGCATAPTLAPAAEDPFAADRAAVADRPAVPTAEVMLPGVELVGFPRRIFGEIHRDTIRGAALVAGWLEEHRSRSDAAGEAFELRATGIQICDEAAVEEGWYALSREAAPNQLVRAEVAPRYLSLWRPVEGAWKLERVWLDPERGVRVTTVATGCEESIRADRGSQRLRLGAGARMGGGGQLQGVAGRMAEAGWPSPTLQNRSAPGAKVWASYRVLGGAAVRTSYERIGRTGLRDYAEIPPDGFRTLTAHVSGHAVRLLGEWRLGPVWLAAGPAVAFMTTEYDERENTPRDRDADTGTIRERLVGGAVEAGVRVTRFPTIQPVLSVDYLYLPELAARVGEYPAPITAGGLILALGMELSF